MSAPFPSFPLTEYGGSIETNPGFLSGWGSNGRWVLPSTLAEDLREQPRAAGGHIGNEARQYGGTASGGATAFQFKTAADDLGRPLYNIKGDDIFLNWNQSGQQGTFQVTWAFEFGAESGMTVSRTVTGIEYQSGYSPTSATSAKVWSADEAGNSIVIGGITKSGKVDHGLLDETLDRWFSQSNQWKINPNGAFLDVNSYGVAPRSDSTDGLRAYVGGSEVFATLSLRGDDINGQGTVDPADDVIEQYGYEAPFRALVPLVRRRNQPTITDLTPNGTGDPYPHGRAGRELSGIINSRKWKDQFGLYDRRSADALAAVGLGYVMNASLWGLLWNAPDSGLDSTAEARFVSQDGMSYRLTIQAGSITAGPGGGFSSMNTRTVLVVPGEGTVFSCASYFENATQVKITKVEVLTGGVYEEIEIAYGVPGKAPPEYPPWAMTGGTVSSTPEGECRVLVVMARRAGERWGFGQYIPHGAGDYPDHNSVPYYSDEMTFVDMASGDDSLGGPQGGGEKKPDGVLQVNYGGGAGGAARGLATGAAASGAGGAARGIKSGSPSRESQPGNSAVQTVKAQSVGSSPSLYTYGDKRSEPATYGDNRTSSSPNAVKSAARTAPAIKNIAANAKPKSVDSGAVSPAKVGGKNLINGSNESHNSGAIGGQNLSNGAIGGQNLSNGAIGGQNLSNGAIGGQNLSNGAIGGQNLSNGAIGGQNLSNGAIGGQNLSNGAIGGQNLSNGAISSDNRNSGAISSSQNLSDGAITRQSRSKSGDSGGKVGGVKKRQKKDSPAPKYVFRKFGEPVKAMLKLTKVDRFDLKTGERLPTKVITWKAVMNGRDWTPELGPDFGGRFYAGDDSDGITATKRGYSFANEGASDNCEVRYDLPDPYGRELSREVIELDVPNTITDHVWFGGTDQGVMGPGPSNFHRVKNSQTGTAIWPEPMIILPKS